MNVLMLDIEVAPNTAHVWGLFKQNISISQIMDSSYVMCWAAKWKDTDEILFDSVKRSGPKRMLRRIHRLLDQADVVVHYNGSRFDVPTLNKEFLVYGMAPPATFQQLDLLKTARKQFRFPSNKLDYIAKALKLGQKIKHSGHDLWVRCMAGEQDAWNEMEQYNKQDVILLERVYNKLLPWIGSHPNAAVYDASAGCPTCGSANLQRRGWAYTQSSKYQRFQCLDCGAWHRSRKSEKTDSLIKDKNG